MEKKNSEETNQIQKGNKLYCGIIETKKLFIKNPSKNQTRKIILKKKNLISSNIFPFPKRKSNNEKEIDEVANNPYDLDYNPINSDNLNKIDYNMEIKVNKKKLNIVNGCDAKIINFLNHNKNESLVGIQHRIPINESIEKVLIKKVKIKIVKTDLKNDFNKFLKHNDEKNEKIKNINFIKEIKLAPVHRPVNNFYGLVSKSDLKKCGNLYEKGFLKKKRKKRFKLKYFDKSCQILADIFCGKNVDLDTFELKIKSKEIIYLLLKKKFDIYFQKSEIISSEDDNKDIHIKLNKLIKGILKFKNIISKKRKEENMKFIFKTTLKKMKIKYFQIKNLKINRMNDKKFYFYYFQIENKTEFFKKIYSINKKKKRKSEFINKKSLALYFSSQKFKNDFLFYMRNHLKSLYMKGIYKKWEVYFKKYENQYQSYDESHENIIIYINNEIRLKYPWTNFEVDLAIENFYTLLKEIKR